MNDSEELAEKYHKLFQDYTRIKAQQSVLKKAVLKEQSENAAIQAAMKEKEQEARKSLQDLDLLSFHNQRLTKRIESLQTLATAKQGGSWLMGGGSVKKELEQSQLTLEALTIDLQSKIEENEKLHQQLYEINALYPRHVTELQGKIQTLQNQNAELQLDVERASVANEDTITMIRKEKQDKEKELGTIRDALADQLKEEQRTTLSLREKVSQLESEIERLTKVEVALEALQKEHAKVKGELETLTWVASEFTQLQESYTKLEGTKIQIEKAHAQLQQQLAYVRQTEEQLRSTLAREQEGSRSLHEKNQRLLKDLEAVRGEAWSREQGQVNEIERLETELTKVLKEQEELQKQFEDLKIAEASAKEGESQRKAQLAKDLSGKESSLQAAEARVKELETLKDQLERELEETKATLETTKAKLAQASAATEATGKAPEATALESVKAEAVEEEGSKDQGDLAGADDEGHATEEDGKPKAPLSKKARKKKAAAAAAAAATAVAVAATASKDAPVEEKDVTEQKPIASKDAPGNSEAVAAAVKAGEEKIRQLEEAQKSVEDSLKKEVESLRAQMETVENRNSLTADQLKTAQASLEVIKDEKASLSSSLEMHVEMTIQLQQEIDDLKAEQSKTQREVSGSKGTSRKDSPTPAVADDDDDKPLIRSRQKTRGADGSKDVGSRAATPVPSDAVIAPVPAASVQDESTQVEHAEGVDKGVQSTQIEMADESTQADLVVATPTPESVGATTATTAAAVEGKSADVIKTRPEKPSRRSVLMEDQSTVANSNQANREHLIKKHYEIKIQNITEQLQVSDGRYARLHREFGMLKDLLMETVQQKSDLQRQLDQLQSKNGQLVEDLASEKERFRAQADSMAQFMDSLPQGR